MQIQDVVIKQSEPVRVAEAAGTAPGFGVENISPVFVPLLRAVLTHLNDQKVRPGINIARYERTADDGSVQLHVGFDIGVQDLPDSAHVRVRDLPALAVASVVHQGPMDSIAGAFDELIRFTRDNGYLLDGTSRELYLEWNEDDPTRHVTELQLPLGNLTILRFTQTADAGGR